MRNSFLILNKKHLGDISFLIGSIYSLLAVSMFTAQFICAMISSREHPIMSYWVDAASGIAIGSCIADLALILGTVFGFLGFLQKEQNKAKSLLGLLQCAVWSALWIWTGFKLANNYGGI